MILIVGAIVGGVAATRPSFAQSGSSSSDKTAASSAELERADELYRRANAAYDAGNLEEAYRLHTEAFAIKKSYDIASNLGQVEFKLGKFASAAEHLAYSISIYPPNGNPVTRAKQQELLSEAKKHVGRFQIQANVDGATITVDGVEVGRTPLSRELFVNPGTRVVEARKEGYKPTAKPMTAQAGQSLVFSLQLEKEDGTEPTRPAGGEKPVWPTALLASAGIAALGTAIGLTVGARIELTEAEDTPTTCAEGPQVCKGRAQESFDQSALLQNVGFAMFGLTAAAGVGLGIYLAVPTDSSSTEDGLRFTPILGPGYAAAAFEGRF